MLGGGRTSGLELHCTWTSWAQPFWAYALIYPEYHRYFSAELPILTDDISPWSLRQIIIYSKESSCDLEETGDMEELAVTRTLTSRKGEGTGLHTNAQNHFPRFLCTDSPGTMLPRPSPHLFFLSESYLSYKAHLLREAFCGSLIPCWSLAPPLGSQRALSLFYAKSPHHWTTREFPCIRVLILRSPAFYSYICVTFASVTQLQLLRNS